MGKKFTLLQQLDEERRFPNDQPTIPSGIKYQEYTMEICEEELTVLIPLRECDAFEQTLTEIDRSLDTSDLRDILRKHRGIRA